MKRWRIILLSLLLFILWVSPANSQFLYKGTFQGDGSGLTGIPWSSITSTPIGTLTDTKWCQYTTAGGVHCDQNAPATGLSASDIVGYTADTSPTSDDLVITVNDPAGTPSFRKVILGNIWKGVFPDLTGKALYLLRVNAAGTGYELANSITGVTVGGYTAYRFLASNASGNATAYSVTASRPVCTDSNQLPTACTNLTDIPLVERVGVSFDGAGSAILVNKIAYIYVPFTGTITEWTVICDTAESTMVVDVLRLTFTAGTLPTASMVGAGNKPTPTNHETQAAPSSWTSIAVIAKDVLAFKVTTGAATATWCTVSLDVTR